MKKSNFVKVASLAAVGAGAAVVLRKKSQEKKAEEKKNVSAASDYRNTERGIHEKNSKGIYYSNGNYEAFARPEKPEGVEEKNAYIGAVDLLLWQQPVFW